MNQQNNSFMELYTCNITFFFNKLFEYKKVHNRSDILKLREQNEINRDSPYRKTVRTLIFH